MWTKRLILLALTSAVFMCLLQCSRSTEPEQAANVYYLDSYHGCLIPEDTELPPELRPGLEGIRLIPLPDREFKVLNGSPINFKNLAGDNPNLYVEIIFTVNPDGTTTIIDTLLKDGGYPDVSIDIQDKIRGWTYEPDCLKMELTFIFSGRHGFIPQQRILEKLPGCTDCGVKVGLVHLVRTR